VTGYTPDRRDLRGGSPADPDRSTVLTRAARFSRWDGSQLVPDLGADEILEALADDVMAEGDVGEALRRLLERGWRSGDPTRPDLPGLRDLLDRLRQRREDLLDRYRLGDVLADVRRELEEIVATERAGVERRLADAAAPTGPDGDPGAASLDPDVQRAARDLAARRLDRLDALPRDLGARVRDLEDYDFLEPEARERFDDLVERLRRTALDQVAKGMADAIRSLTPEDLAANREMVRDLDRLLQERLAGGDPDASAFLARHGHFFPGAQDLDDIIDQLSDRMAAMQSLMSSLTPEQRAELQDLMDAALRDDRLRWDLAQLAATLDQLLPDGLGERLRFGGDEPLGLEAALERIGEVQSLASLEAALEDVAETGDLADVDRERVGDLLGEESARDLDALRQLAETLERAGYLTRDGEHLALTPRGTRRIGQKVLDDLFARLRRDAFGGHRIDRTGRGGEPEETTKRFEFGDPFLLDLRATLDNALRREENAVSAGAGPRSRPIRLAAEDFEVRRTELLTRTSTVLLVDMSRSMLLRGCFVAAKKVAIALDTLIRSQFPRDDLTIIGFAYYAREIRPEALAELAWHGYEYGTNLQHGLMLARRYLSARPGGNREIVVITDGEPTAHFEDGQVEFNYPPTRRTIQETLREVARCTKAGITINTFMLERSRALAEFVAVVTRLNRGRAFYADPEHLGEYVLVDFVSRRTKRVA
jgi:uncharacterized protein with von Willebrand factor type A (vWA) domain